MLACCRDTVALEQTQYHHDQNSSDQHASGVYGWSITCHPTRFIPLVIPLVSSHSFYHIQFQSRQSPGGSEESITDSAPDRLCLCTIFGSSQGLCNPRRSFCTQKGTIVRRVLAHSKEIKRIPERLRGCAHSFLRRRSTDYTIFQ